MNPTCEQPRITPRSSQDPRAFTSARRTEDPFRMAKSEEKAREMRETGERLKIARKARDMTQEQLADAAKVDQTAVSKAERGKFHLEDPTLGRLADALGVTLAWLRHGEGIGPTAGPSTDELRASATTKESAMRRVEAPHRALDEALDAAFDKARGHRLSDVDVIRDAFRAESVPAACSPEMLVKVAGRLLGAVAQLRAEGYERITLAEIVLKVAA